MLAGRRVSQDQAFAAALKPARRGETAGKVKVEKALRELGDAGGSKDDQALVVQRFLDSHDASALTPKARAALLEFVAQAGAPSSGERQLEVRRAARASTGQAKASAEAPHAKVLSLLQKSSTAQERRDRHARVTAWLDAADADLAQAGARLAALATGARLKGSGSSQKDASQARLELEALLQGARPGDVRQRDVEQVRQWLSHRQPD